jgi:hypothetical protein
MAEHFRVPIESFLEKATFLSKPVPSARPQTQLVKAPREEPTPEPPSADVEATPASTEPAKKKKSPKKTSKAKITDSETPVNVSESLPDQPETINVNGSSGEIIQKKRKKPTSDSPPSKRRKSDQPRATKPKKPKVNDPKILERENIVLSLLKQNEGVLELVPQLDELYATHVAEHFPNVVDPIDGGTILYTIDCLEERGQLVRILLSTITSTGLKLYKSVLILPEIDPHTNAKIRDLRNALQLEMESHTPSIQNGEHITEDSISTEIIRKSIHDELLPPLQAQHTERRKRKKREDIEPPEPQDLEGSSLPIIANETGAAKKRQRVTFGAEEDKRIYQAMSLVQKYCVAEDSKWSCLKNVLPGRKEGTIRKRYSLLKHKMRGSIPRFLSVFERKYTDAVERGEIEVMKKDDLFDLKYYLDWYNVNGFEVEEESVQLPRYSLITLIAKR